MKEIRRIIRTMVHLNYSMCNLVRMMTGFVLSLGSGSHLIDIANYTFQFILQGVWPWYWIVIYPGGNFSSSNVNFLSKHCKYKWMIMSYVQYVESASFWGTGALQKQIVKMLYYWNPWNLHTVFIQIKVGYIRINAWAKINSGVQCSKVKNAYVKCRKNS